MKPDTPILRRHATPTLLQSLVVCTAGIWQYVFRQDLQLQQLTRLQFHYIKFYDLSPGQDAVSALAFMTTADIGRLASSCPALKELEMGLQPGAQLAARSQLTSVCAYCTDRLVIWSIKTVGWCGAMCD